MVRIRSFIAILSTKLHDCLSLDFGPDETPSQWVARRDGPLHFWYCPRSLSTAPSDPPEHIEMLLLGDDAEWDAAQGDTNLVHAVPIQYDRYLRQLTVLTSVMGLPPVFVYRSSHCVAVASDLYLIAGLSPVTLRLDPVGVKQLGRIGHPVGNRTLFENTELLPAGARVSIGVDHAVQIAHVWRGEQAQPVGWNEFVEIQSAAFMNAVRRIDVSRSFLSLTAGLDTRTVFAALERQNRLIPAVTMSGLRRSVDARIAQKLCGACCVPHRLITFDERFTNALPVYIERASRLSGGLHSLEQATEVFFYDQLRGEFAARLSGNFGNQIGRGGIERLSLRKADTNVLSPSISERAGREPRNHWLLTQLDQSVDASLRVLLQQEIPFTSVGNFSLGNHFVTQQTPYASRLLIDTLAFRPARGSAPSSSRWHMRLRDLNHRFLGQFASISFQRSLLQRLGGMAAKHPINYGWLATGGISPVGLLLGAGAVLGILAQQSGLDSGSLAEIVARTGLPALHGFRHSRLWLRQHLEEFTRDTLSMRAVHRGGVFIPYRLQALLDDHFRGAEDHYDTITFALDVTLAQQLFCSKR